MRDEQEHARTWAATLRIEQRYGVMRYVLLFTNGRLTASLFGSIDPRSSLSPTEIGWQVAADWLSHVRPHQPKRRRSSFHNKQKSFGGRRRERV